MICKNIFLVELIEVFTLGETAGAASLPVVSKRVVDDYWNKIKEIEENYNNQATTIAQRLESLPIEDQVRIIENDKKRIIRFFRSIKY